MWVRLAWEGMKPEKWPPLPDGRDVEEAIRVDGFSALPSPVWLVPWNWGRMVDWLWTGGTGLKVFSQAMIDAFDSAGVVGMETLPVTIRRQRSADIEGYSLVRFTSESQIKPFPDYSVRMWSFTVPETVRDAVVAAKLKGFTLAPYETELAELKELERLQEPLD